MCNVSQCKDISWTLEKVVKQKKLYIGNSISFTFSVFLARPNLAYHKFGTQILNEWSNQRGRTLDVIVCTVRLGEMVLTRMPWRPKLYVWRLPLAACIFPLKFLTLVSVGKEVPCGLANSTCLTTWSKKHSELVKKPCKYADKSFSWYCCLLTKYWAYVTHSSMLTWLISIEHCTCTW